MDETPASLKKLNVQPGDHILAIVTDEDDLSLLPPYASDGIARGDTCSVFSTSEEMDAVRQCLRHNGIAVDQLAKTGQLLFSDPREIGRNATGEFDAHVLLEKLELLTCSLVQQKIHHLRSMGSMSWLPGTASANDGIYICARINEIFRAKPISGL